MTPEQFAELAKAGFNRIPVYREVLADLDTPLSTYFKLASGLIRTCSNPFRGVRNGAVTQSSACRAEKSSRFSTTTSPSPGMARWWKKPQR